MNPFFVVYHFNEFFEKEKAAVMAAMSKYRNAYTHPYVIHTRRRKPRAGGYIAYKCSPKGRKVCCELFYRKSHGLDLKWNGFYNIKCTGVCDNCQYNPTLKPDAWEIISRKD